MAAIYEDRQRVGSVFDVRRAPVRVRLFNQEGRKEGLVAKRK